VRIAASLRARCDAMLVLGIGGSALGAAAVDAALGDIADPHRLVILDTVDPVAVRAALGALDPRRTAVAVISKSGGTIETAALFRVVVPWLETADGDFLDRVVFVTDPAGGSLRPLARELGVTCLPVPPDVGGRFSVLTAVGVLPLAFRGIEIPPLLAGAAAARDRALSRDPLDPAAAFAGIHELSWPAAQTTVWIAYCERLRLLGEWFQQLWGESLGKPTRDGVYGWTPVVARGPADQHSQLQLWQQGPNTRIVTFVRVDDGGASLPIPSPSGPLGRIGDYLAGASLESLLDAERRGTMTALVEAGRPVLDLSVPKVDGESVGALIMTLELATALAGFLRDIDPFDQPGVEAGKQFAYGLLGRSGYEDRRDRVRALLG
jgi:glucose-6-phosphate isomerase